MQRIAGVRQVSQGRRQHRQCRVALGVVSRLPSTDERVSAASRLLPTRRAVRDTRVDGPVMHWCPGSEATADGGHRSCGHRLDEVGEAASRRLPACEAVQVTG